MRHIVLLFALLASIESFGSDDDLKETSCVDVSNKYLDQTWHSSHQWREVFEPDQLVKTFRSKTSTWGVWVEKSEINGQIFRMSKLTNTSQYEVIIESQTCAPKITEKSIYGSDQVPKGPKMAPANALTDDVLAKVLAQTKQGVIYLWSPHMMISILGLIEATAAAKELKLKIIPLLSKNSNLDAALLAIKTYNLAPEAMLQEKSFELTMRNIDQHFPSFVVFKMGEILNNPYRGFEDKKTYSLIFKSYLTKNLL